jgi:hypothetical protein
LAGTLQAVTSKPFVHPITGSPDHPILPFAECLFIF